MKRKNKYTDEHDRMLFELWLRLGTQRRAIEEFNKKSSEGSKITCLEVAQRHIQKFMLYHTDEAIVMWKKSNPEMSEDGMRDSIMFYAIRFFKSARRYKEWAAISPWTKRYQKTAEAWYGEHL